MSIFDIIGAEFETALSEPVKRKANRTGKIKLRDQAARVASRAPEVMVKITGFGKGGQHVKAHLDYISRNGKVCLENERGEMVNGKAQVRVLFSEWAEDFGDVKRRKNQRDTMHLVLSMPAGTGPEAVRAATRAFAKKTFGQNHEYVFALHTDEPHPHCHLTVKCLGYDSRRLNPRKADLQAWREGFAAAMREHGFDAAATPRRSRGVVRKSQKSVLRHIERGDSHRPPRVSKVRAAQIKEVAQELSAQAHGQTPQIRPWETSIKARQTTVRRAWLAAAQALERPKPPVLYKQEPHNEPDYAAASIGTRRNVRIVPTWADVHQPGTAKPGPKQPTVPLSSVRDLSGITLVHQQGSTQMFLRADARHHVGQPGIGTADHDMRRERAGHHSDARITGSAAEASGLTAATVDDKTLAQRIRGFVANMPSIDTVRHQMRRELLARFGRAPDQSQESGLFNKPERGATER